MLYNITERIQVEQQSIELAGERERIKILQQFISNISHDFKTPLSILNTNQYLLRKELGEASESRLDVMDLQTKRLTKLVENMLLMVSLDADEKPTMRPIYVSSLIQNMLIYFEESEPSITLIPFEPELQFVGNEQEIALALFHLIDNAIQYTPSDGTITLTVATTPQHITITVHDTGMGIPTDEQQNIFGQFYRLDESRNTNQGTSGLGLAIVKRVAERHNGTVTVDSTEGVGSAFTLTLPRTIG